jgi:ubiquinone biosynthesis protein
MVRTMRWTRADERPESRRREVESRLEACRVWKRRAAPSGEVEELPVELPLLLREALQSLGPVFSSFGLYLASRVDLLPPAVCRELGNLTDREEALPPAAVHALLREELTVPLPDCEEEPFVSRAHVQLHRARLAGGEEAVVKLVRPDFEARLATDLDLLPLLSGVYPGGGVWRAVLQDAITDFRRTLRLRLDLATEAECLALLAADAGSGLVAPRVRTELSTRRILTLETTPGVGVDRVRPPAVDVARGITFAWLRQALLGRAFPFEPESDLRLLADVRVLCLGGPCATLPAATQTRLWDYLGGAALQDPAEACVHLLPELVRGDDALPADQLFLRLRQIVPFRDGAWNEDSEGVADHLFAQWRMARESGYRPQLHLLPFWRGLAAIAAVSRRLAPERDVLREAVDDLRLATGASHLRDSLNAGKILDDLGPYAQVMLQVPQKLDEIMNLLARGEARVKVQMEDGAPSGSGRITEVLALGIALGALGFSWPKTAPALLGSWSEPVGALVFLLIGGLLLRALVRLR